MIEEIIPVERFAELDENNYVINIIDVGQNVLVDAEGNVLSFPESDIVGRQFLETLFHHQNWRQSCSESSHVYRGKVACIGDKYDPINDIFYVIASDDSDIQSS